MSEICNMHLEDKLGEEPTTETCYVRKHPLQETYQEKLDIRLTLAGLDLSRKLNIRRMCCCIR